MIMWIFFGLYMTSSLSPAGHTFMIAFFAINVILAHIAAFLIYGLPFIRKRFSSR
ncbi:hypothetical protein M2369_001402 [Bacillus sp. JUb11]|nr:hypothetical protein [Bacillus sp. JUb11]